MRIWKYAVEPMGRPFATSLPIGARFLAVQMQHGESVMWWLVRPSGPSEARRFVVVGTGHDVPDGATYLGTFQQHGGFLVLHLFDLGTEAGDAE